MKTKIKKAAKLIFLAGAITFAYKTQTGYANSFDNVEITHFKNDDEKESDTTENIRKVEPTFEEYDAQTGKYNVDINKLFDDYLEMDNMFKSNYLDRLKDDIHNILGDKIYSNEYYDYKTDKIKLFNDKGKTLTIFPNNDNIDIIYSNTSIVDSENEYEKYYNSYSNYNIIYNRVQGNRYEVEDKVYMVKYNNKTELCGVVYSRDNNNLFFSISNHKLSIGCSYGEATFKLNSEKENELKEIICSYYSNKKNIIDFIDDNSSIINSCLAEVEEKDSTLYQEINNNIDKITNNNNNIKVKSK